MSAALAFLRKRRGNSEPPISFWLAFTGREGRKRKGPPPTEEKEGKTSKKMGGLQPREGGERGAECR